MQAAVRLVPQHPLRVGFAAIATQTIDCCESQRFSDDSPERLHDFPSQLANVGML